MQPHCDIGNPLLSDPSNTFTSAQQSGYQASNADSTGFNNVQGISNEDSILRPFSDSVDEHSVPPLINLETVGLQRSPRLAAIQNNDASAIAAYTSSTTPSMEENSCNTPGILMPVIAYPSNEESKIRLKALPIVTPYPFSKGLNSNSP